MNLNVFCKASTQIGLGHLIRSYSFVEQIIEKHKNIYVKYYLIGDISLKKLIKNTDIEVLCCEKEQEILSFIEQSDISIID